MTATTASTSASVNPAGRLPFPFLRQSRLRLAARWYDRHLHRLDLAEVDEYLLHDLGLTREDVRRECAKSFWQT